jgi:hypothetical protein
MTNITAEQPAAKQRTEQIMTVGFRGGNYKVPAMRNEINTNPAIHASDRQARMNSCKSELQFLITDITNAADRYYRKSGNNVLTNRENTNKTVKYAITHLFNNKTFAAEFVSNPFDASNKVIAAVNPETKEGEIPKEGGLKAIIAMVKKNRYHERGRFLAGVPVKRM